MPALASDHVDYAVAARAKAEGEVSGDLHHVWAQGSRTLIAVADGLGHGSEAAAAARAAVAVLDAQPHLDVLAAMEACHLALRGTRGAVLALAALDAADATLTWLSVGNVEGVLLRNGRDIAKEFIWMRGGIVGHRLPPLRPARAEFRADDLLLLATDGVSGGFERAVIPGVSSQENADRILSAYGKTVDDALVLVARWRGGG